MADDIRAVRRHAIAKGALDRVIGEPAGLDQVQFAAARERALRQRLLQPAIHRHGMRLAVKAEPAEKQDGDILFADPEPLTPRRAHPRHRHIGIAIDAERDDRQLRPARAYPAEPRLEIGRLRVEHGIDRGAHRRAGADHRIPGLDRRDQPIGDDFDNFAGDDRVGDSDDAVGLLIVAAAAPGELIDADRRVKQTAGFGQALRLGKRDPGHRHIGAVGLHARCEILRIGRAARVTVKPAGAAVPHKAAQEALAGGVPAHQPRPARVKRVDRVIDRRVGPRHAAHHSQPLTAAPRPRRSCRSRASRTGLSAGRATRSPAGAPAPSRPCRRSGCRGCRNWRSRTAHRS